MLLATKHEVPVSIISNAVDGMFREHHSMVFRTAYRITGNAADAEDVLQTVFLRIAGRDESAAVIELPENYLRRSAVHAALDLVRARRQPAAVDLEPVPAEDVEMLMATITARVEATGSPRGKWVLENWENMLPRFIKVFPHEYKRVLGIQRQQVAVA